MYFQSTVIDPKYKLTANTGSVAFFHHVFLIIKNVEQNVYTEYYVNILNAIEESKVTISAAFGQVINGILTAEPYSIGKQEPNRYDFNRCGIPFSLTVKDISELPRVASRMTVIRTKFPDGDQRKNWDNALFEQSVADSVMAAAVAYIYRRGEMDNCCFEFNFETRQGSL